jgi:uncharacterized protein YmfQ (DUF2313 family)
MMIDRFLKLTKQLYPSGRAWWMRKSGILEKIHQGLIDSEVLAYENLKSLYNSILPDNANFSLEDAANWEKALGLLTNLENDLETRKSAIIRKINHPGNVKARQSYLFLQGQLQLAGFDVYVHENRPTIYNFVEALYDQVKYGQVTYGQSEAFEYTKVANQILASENEDFNLGNLDNAKELFFVGGETFPDFAIIPSIRENEFRELILRLKPAHTVAIIMADFVYGIGFATIGLTIIS